LYNILIEFDTPIKLVEMTETKSRIRVGNNLSDMCPIRNG